MWSASRSWSSIFLNAVTAPMGGACTREKVKEPKRGRSPALRLEWIANRSGTGLADMDAHCLAELLSRTSPEDACRLAGVCKEWSQAAASDIVWEKFLPTGYLHYVNASHPKPPEYSNLQELYRLLAGKGLLIDSGKQLVKICRGSKGLLKMYVAAEGMWVVLGDHLAHMEDSFPTVYWFQLGASLRCRLPLGRYSVSWILAGKPTLFSLGKVYSKIVAEGGEEMVVEVDMTEQSLGECEREWSEMEVGEVNVGKREEMGGLGILDMTVELLTMKGDRKTKFDLNLVLRQKED